MSLSEKFVKPISGISYAALKRDVLDKAKMCILHSLACTYAGRDASWSKAARELTAELHPDRGASVWFFNQYTNMADAAFTNAVAAQSILHEDIHRDSNAHPGVIVIPAAIAVGERCKSSGRQVLEAIVAGYEMMGRIGRGTVCPEFTGRGFRPTSIIGTFGSSMAAGKLMGLSPTEHLAAFSLSASFTSGINEWAIAGTDDLYFQNGMASRSGIVAAALAKRGVAAPMTILEGKAGLCNAFGFSLANLEAVDLNDGRYVITDVRFKPAPACALVQTTAQAALDAARAGVKAENVARGTIYTFELGKTYAGCDNAGPFENILQARMSNQFNFAATMIRDKISNENYLKYHDPEIAGLAGKLKVEAVPEFTQMFPDRQPVRVELVMNNGQSFSFCREEPVYLKRDDIVGKLYDYCSPALGKSGVDKIIDTVEHLEDVEDIGVVHKLFLR